jgi:hypothetical protein
VNEFLINRGFRGGRLRARLVLTLLSLWVVFGCGGGGSRSTGQVRFVAVSPNAPALNLVVDGKTLFSNLAYSNSSDYLALAVGSRHIRAIPVNGTAPILDSTVAVGASTYQTMLLAGPASQVQPVLLTDGGTTATSGNGSVRLVNASETMGAADVYLVPAGTSLASVQPVAAGLGFEKNTGYQAVAVGSYEAFLTAPGTKNVFLATGPINLTASQNQTVVALDSISGGFTFTALIDQ